MLWVFDCICNHIFCNRICRLCTIWISKILHLHILHKIVCFLFFVGLSELKMAGFLIESMTNLHIFTIMFFKYILLFAGTFTVFKLQKNVSTLKSNAYVFYKCVLTIRRKQVLIISYRSRIRGNIQHPEPLYRFRCVCNNP